MCGLVFGLSVGFFVLVGYGVFGVLLSIGEFVVVVVELVVWFMLICFVWFVVLYGLGCGWEVLLIWLVCDFWVLGVYVVVIVGGFVGCACLWVGGWWVLCFLLWWEWLVCCFVFCLLVVLRLMSVCLFGVVCVFGLVGLWYVVLLMFVCGCVVVVRCVLWVDVCLGCVCLLGVVSGLFCGFVLLGLFVWGVGWFLGLGVCCVGLFFVEGF